MNELESYLSYLKNNKKYSENTLKSYRNDLNSFMLFLKNEEISIDSCKDSDLDLFIYNLKKQKFAISSINRKIVAIRNFYKYYSLFINNEFVNTISSYEVLKAPKRLPKYLFDNQVEELLKMPESSEKLAIRNQCIVMLLLYTGMRVSELVALDLMDIDLEEHCIRVFGKGRKERMVFFHEECDLFLNKYLAETRKPMLKNELDNAVFIGSKGTRISARAVEDILNYRSSKASVPFDVSPHMLRHTFATKLLDSGMDIRFVQELLGHESLSTTQIYTHVSLEKLKNVYENSFPLAMKLRKENNERD